MLNFIVTNPTDQVANQRAAQASLILRVAERISSALDLDTVFAEIVNGIYETLGFYNIMLFLLDDSRQRLELKKMAGGYENVFRSDLSIDISEGMTGAAVRSKKIQLSGDVASDPNYVQKAGELTKSELVVPILNRDEVIGVLDMQSNERHAFSEGEVESAATLSSLIATAIENARLYERTQQDLEKYRQAQKEIALRATQNALIFEVGQRINSSLDLNKLLSEIVHAVCDMFDYYGVMLMMLDEKSATLNLQSIAGGYADVFPGNLSIKIGEGMIGTAAKLKNVQMSNDVSKDPNYVQKADEVTKSELSLPIVKGSSVIGVLDIQSDRLNAFNESDVAVAWTLSSQVATAIENARLYTQAQIEIRDRKEAEKELRKSRNNLRKAKRETDGILQNVEEGLFLLDKNMIIGSAYSRALESILDQENLAGMTIISILENKLPAKEMESATEFLELMFDPAIDEESLSVLNPLSEIAVSFTGHDLSKHLAFNFRRITVKNKISGLIATVRDISEQVQLAQKLEQSQKQSKRQMDWLLGILHVEPQLLKEFIDGVNAELKYIDAVLRDSDHLTDYRLLLEKVYRSVHLIKGNASVLDLKFFVEKAHTFEEKLSAIRHKDAIKSSDFIPLVLQLSDIRMTVRELNNLIARISKIHSHFRPKRSYESEVFVKSINNLVQSLSGDLDKKVNLDTSKFDAGMIPYEFKLTVREIIIQLVRNAIYHGIEDPRERKKLGKASAGKIQISNINTDQHIGIRFRDDGRGLQIQKLREKAINFGRWSKEEIVNWSEKEVVQTIFTTGISTLDRANLVAGRGVGLDIVKNKVEHFYGQIEVDFQPNRFTQFTILFPNFERKAGRGQSLATDPVTK